MAQYSLNTFTVYPLLISVIVYSNICPTVLYSFGFDTLTVWNDLPDHICVYPTIASFIA